MAGADPGAPPRVHSSSIQTLMLTAAAVAAAAVVGLAIGKSPALAVVAVFGGFAVLALLRDPLLALLCLAAAIPFELQSFLQGQVMALTGIKILGLTALAAWLMSWLTTGRHRLRFDRQMLFFGGFLFCLALSALGAPNLLATMDAAVRWAQMLILYVLAQAVVDDRRGVRRLFWVILSTMAISALWGIVQGLSGMRAQGFADDPNDFCLYLLVALYTGLALVSSTEAGEPGRKAKAAACTLIGFVVLAIIFTGSRGGFVTLLASGAIWLYLQPRKSRALLAALAVASVFAVLAPGGYWARIQTLSKPGKDTSLQGRMYELEAGVKMIERHPFLGVGTGNFTQVYTAYSRDPRREGRLAHNLYVQIGAENGLIGLAAFFLLAGHSLRRLRRLESQLQRDDPGGLHPLVFGTLLALAAFLIGSAFLSSQYVKYFYLLLGIVPVFSRLAEEAAVASNRPETMKMETL
ncbi:MAG: O-antigen ligase family protein [Candidatus Sumerlaeota bacterium]|nr:O-antigen ligase family protein [Candidatus Sumerlaeota bacterium]